MTTRLKCGLTAGIAVVGASVIAITPIAAPTPPAPRAVEASAALMADFTGMNQAGLVFMAGQRLANQFAQAPLVPLILAAQLAAGDNERFFSQLRQVVDSPVYVADPLIEAIAITLPEEFGGGSDHVTNTATDEDGAFMQFRNNELLGLRDGINAQFAAALGVDTPWPNENYAAALAAGLQESAVRSLNGAVLGTVGLVAVAQAVAEGDNVELYKAIRSYTDAPLWTVDPTIEGLAQALPRSLGGGTDGDFTTTDPDDGALMRFRNETLWGATRDTRRAVARVLNVELDPQDNPVEVETSSERSSVLAADVSGKRDVSNFKPHVNASINKSLDDAKDRAEQRRDRVKANVNKTVAKAKEAAAKVAKKLSPKKDDSED